MINRIAEWPLVSVVVPVFNSERYLAQALDSTMRQTYPHIERIVVDDGSTDSSLDVLSTYGDSIRLIPQANAGSAKARNVGIEASRGSLIAFLDADDLWHPEKIRIQVEQLMSRPAVALIYSNWLVVEEDSGDKLDAFLTHKIDDHSLSVIGELSGFLYSKLLLDCVVHTSSAIVRKSALERVGLFDESLQKGQDYDLWIRLSRISEFIKLSPVLSVYRLHNRGITRQTNPVNYAAHVVSRALAKWGRVGPDGRAVSRLAMRRRLSRIWFDFAGLHLSAGSRVQARDSIWRSIRYTPWNLHAWRLYARSILPRSDFLTGDRQKG